MMELTQAVKRAFSFSMVSMLDYTEL